MFRSLHNLYPGSTKRTATVLGMPQSPVVNQDGGILFDGDDWTYDTFGANEQQFAENWLAAMGASPGDSIIFFNVTMMGDLTSWMTTEGYTVVDGSTVPFNAATYSTYKVALLSINDAQPYAQTFIDYVQQGGNAYVQGGLTNGPFERNIFANMFGVNYDALVIDVGTTPTSGVGLFAGVTQLYHDNANNLSVISSQASIIYEETVPPINLMAAYNL